MAEYTFHCDNCDKSVDIQGSMKNPPLVVLCSVCEYSMWRVYNPRVIASPSMWPQISDAAGVGSQQVEEAYKKSVELGVPTQFTSDGQAIFESRGHRKRYCEKFGLYDRSAGYGDQAPVNLGKSDESASKVPILNF